jgi:hypothetical protein
MVTGLLSTDFYWFVVSPCLEIFECRRACLAMDSCWLEDWVSIGKFREKYVCLEASWLREWEFVLGDYQKRSCRRSLVWDIVECRRPRVFGEWLITFNCSVFTFWNGNKLPSWIEPPSTLQCDFSLVSTKSLNGFLRGTVVFWICRITYHIDILYELFCTVFVVHFNIGNNMSQWLLIKQARCSWRGKATWHFGSRIWLACNT